MQQITVLGATGSIGVSTLDVVARHPGRYQVFALAANTQDEALFAQCRQFRPQLAVMADPLAAERLRARIAAAQLPVEVLSGEEALVAVASAPEVDTVMAAIVGAAGLSSALAAAEHGKRVLLANKESLVMAGSLFMSAVQRGGATLLPIDSEHNAIFQALPADFCRQKGVTGSGVSKLLLTASGGPFRRWSQEQLARATPEQACAHPNWSMGQKISVDSATLMNKGLELIEACWLFGVSPRQVEVVVHPQSVIHSLVQYLDGSVLAQLGNPDMRTPIAHALAWPERIEAGVQDLNLFEIARLDFEAPDLERFPCLRLAREAMESGGICPAILNAANEVAVAAFLDGRLDFMGIAEVNERVLNGLPNGEPKTLEDVQLADRDARALAAQFITDKP